MSKSTVYFMFIHFWLVNSIPQMMVSQFPCTPACYTSPPFSPLLQTPIFGSLLCGNWLVCGSLRFKAMVYFFFVVAHFLPKQWYHISPLPPNCCTSPPYSLLLWRPIFGWLLCEQFLIGVHPNAIVYYIYIYFPSCEKPPQTMGHIPPTSTQTSSLPLPPSFGWLLVIVIHQRPPKAKAQPISMFLMRLFLVP